MWPGFFFATVVITLPCAKNAAGGDMGQAARVGRVNK